MEHSDACSNVHTILHCDHSNRSCFCIGSGWHKYVNLVPTASIVAVEDATNWAAENAEIEENLP